MIGPRVIAAPLFHLVPHCLTAGLCRPFSSGELRLPDVLERQGLSLSLLSKRVMSLILEKHLVFLEYFPASLKILEYFKNCSFMSQ